MTTTTTTTTSPQQFKMMNPEFEALVQRIVSHVAKDELAELRKDFHTRLRITLTHPDSADLIEDLWDFFYDWCVFEHRLPEKMKDLGDEERATWNSVKAVSSRGLYAVSRANDDGLKLKELFTGKTFVVPLKNPGDFLGISKGDIIEGRLLGPGEVKNPEFSFMRRPSYHPTQVHGYIKEKVKQFKKAKDYSTYQNWLWLLVGMYLKHRIYQHMPIEKIYDDNSRI